MASSNNCKVITGKTVLGKGKARPKPGSRVVGQTVLGATGPNPSGGTRRHKGHHDRAVLGESIDQKRKQRAGDVCEAAAAAESLRAEHQPIISESARPHPWMAAEPTDDPIGEISSEELDAIDEQLEAATPPTRNKGRPIVNSGKTIARGPRVENKPKPDTHGGTVENKEPVAQRGATVENKVAAPPRSPLYPDPGSTA